MVSEWWESDKFYLELTPDEKVDFLSYIGQPGHLGPSFTSLGKYFGEIKHCSNCKERRITSCCACGCGSCYTCGYRWCCYGWHGKPFEPDKTIPISAVMPSGYRI